MKVIRPPAELGAAPVETRGGQNRLGDYVLLDRLGSGGSGVVYRAWQLSLQRFVALKLVEDGEASEADRFEREARTAAKLSHPHIVPIYEVGQHEGRRYLAMKLIEGRAMNRVRVEPRQAVALMCQAINAIDYAHRNGVVHRDLKPHNLILEGDDHVWVTDFGIARSTRAGSTLTAAGSVMGTPAYMPPEQARGLRCDERSDVYALGATLYELLTGRPPFDATGDLLVLMNRVLSSDPAPPRRHNPRVPPDVEIVVGKAMAKSPGHRYQTARDFEDDLRRTLEGEPIRARPPGLLRRSAKWVRRHPMPSGALVFLVALGLGAGFHTLSLERQLAETTIAEANALGAAGEWEAARARYTRAAAAFDRLGVTSAAPELGLLDAYHHAPPPLLVLRGHGATVRAIEFLPDGQQAISASNDGTLRLWDVPLGREIRAFRGHRGPVTSVALSPDGRRALSGGEDGSLRLWDVASGNELTGLHTRGGAVLKVALSPDGKHALSRTADGVVQLWELPGGRERRSFEVATKRLIAVGFSPDGRLALTGRMIEEKGSPVNARASLWEVESGREVQTMGSFGGEIESIVFSPDGRRALTAGYDRIASVWDLQTGQRVLRLRGHLHGLTGAAFSPKDRIIVSAGRDNAVMLWNADDGKLVRALDTGATVEALAVSPDGNFILTGGSDSTIKLWDPTVGQEMRTFSGHEGAVLSVALTADGRLALSGGADGKMRLWDVATGRELRAFDHGLAVHAVAISPDGRRAVSGGTGSQLRLWDVGLREPPRPLSGQSGTIRSIAFTADGTQVLTASDTGQVKLWDADTGRAWRTWTKGEEIRNVALSADGKRVFAASFDGTASLWDVDSGRELRLLRPASGERMGAAALADDGRLGATGDETKVVRLWDLESGRQLHELLGHVGDLRSLRFLPGSRLLLSASRDRTVRVWDTQSGRELHAFSWASDAIRGMATSADGRFALVGTDDGSMHLWDFTHVRQQRALEERVAAARAVLAHAPTDADALATLGAWYAFRGVSSWAIKLLRRAEEAGAAPSALMLARSYFRNGDFPSARRELERALVRGEAPAAYLNVLIRDIGSSEQAGRLAQLNSKDGRVRFPFLGIRVRDDRGPGAAAAPGAVITRVIPRSPAAAAGLRVGDRIVGADDLGIDSGGALDSFLASRTAGAAVTLAFAREGVRTLTTATLTERPARVWEPDGRQVRESRSGYALQTMNPELALSLGLDPETQGAVVTEVSALAPEGATRRIAVDDVIVRVHGHPVASAEQTVAALSALSADAWNDVAVIRPGRVR